MTRGTRPGIARRRGQVAMLAMAAGLVAFALTGMPSTAWAAPFPWTHYLTRDLLRLPTGSAPAPYAADWNGDGLDDLVVGMQTVATAGGVAVHERSLDGSLRPAVSAFATGDAGSVVGPGSFYRPVVVDWNADGASDLLLGQSRGSAGVLFCPAEGPAGAPPVIHGARCSQLRTDALDLVGRTTGSDQGFLSPEVVDWDEDGDLDLLVGSGSAANEKGIRLYRNIGDRSRPVLAAPETVVSRAGTSGLAFENFYEPDVLDMDDDGRKDLLIGGSRRGSELEFVLRQCLNAGSDEAPSFPSCSFLFLPGLVNNVIDFHDWDRDGAADLLRGFSSNFIANPVSVFLGTPPDTDGDGVVDPRDNCPDLANPARLRLDRRTPAQVDTDGDGAGDPCDADDDGDAVEDPGDNCPWTPNQQQADSDGDRRGDACDPRDDRPGHPGIGSYEWQQANRMQWGRRPVILLRADALSLGFRRDIAIAVTEEALRRGIAFSLGVIPWDAARFRNTPSAEFLQANAADPNLEITQHGTYHTCVLEGGAGEEFDCGMDAAESFNLMRVGHRSLVDSVDFTAAAQPLTGFLPPADAYDAATGAAAAALGHRYIASAYYREQPAFVFVDDLGLVHVPWGQTACGNGFAPWINCQTTQLTAHAGVDCADEPICRPTRDGRSYDPWSDYSPNTLAERCRYDMRERYDGVCSIIFELAVLDTGDGSGTLDPVALAGYRRTLDDLQRVAEEEGAVFMTLGQFAAAKLIDDTAPPAIDIRSPAGDYEHHEAAVVAVDVQDDLSGVHSVRMELDGSEIVNGDRIDMLDLPLGAHRLVVRAEDTAGNAAEAQTIFEVVATFASLRAAIQRLAGDGAVDDDGVARSLLRKVAAAEASAGRGQLHAAREILAALVSEVEAQRDRHVSGEAADLLVADAEAVAAGLGSP